MAGTQIPVDPSARVDDEQGDKTHQVAADLGCQRLVIVIVAFCGAPGACCDGPGRRRLEALTGREGAGQG